MYADDDSCVIDVGLAPNAKSDVASFLQVAQAAFAVLESCNPMGGVAWNIGK